MGLEVLVNDIATAVAQVQQWDYATLKSVTNGSNSILEETTQANDKVEEPLLEYSLLDGKLSSSRPLDYKPLSYAESSTAPAAFESEDDYWSVTPIQDTESETMTVPEAEETLQDIQYASALNTRSDVDYTERRRFATWCMFNGAERQLFHALYALTAEVDYGRVF